MRVKTTSHIKKLFPTEVGGGSGEIGMVSQLLPVFNYDSFPNKYTKVEFLGNSNAATILFRNDIYNIYMYVERYNLAC